MSWKQDLAAFDAQIQGIDQDMDKLQMRRELLARDRIALIAAHAPWLILPLEL